MFFKNTSEKKSPTNECLGIFLAESDTFLDSDLFRLTTTYYVTGIRISHKEPLVIIPGSRFWIVKERGLILSWGTHTMHLSWKSRMTFSQSAEVLTYLQKHLIEYLDFHAD